MTAHTILSAAAIPKKPPIPEDLESARARKRRKEMMNVNRSSSPSTEDSKIVASNSFESDHALGGQGTSARDGCISEPPVTAASDPMVADLSSAMSENKFLLRYDPKVPMTKEETSAWRKEERRKRNRESAAASRQKTRDRITELEEEVNLWKSKFDEAARRIAALEELYKTQRIAKVRADPVPQTTNALLSFDSPKNTPSVSPLSTPPQSPIPSMALISPSSLIRPPELGSDAGVELKKNKMNEGKHFKEIFQQATYEILCF